MNLQNSMPVILGVFYVNSWLKYLLLVRKLSLQHAVTANLTFNAWVRFGITLGGKQSCNIQIINLRSVRGGVMNFNVNDSSCFWFI